MRDTRKLPVTIATIISAIHSQMSKYCPIGVFPSHGTLTAVHILSIAAAGTTEMYRSAIQDRCIGVLSSF
jgi:hypothetical protein